MTTEIKAHNDYDTIVQGDDHEDDTIQLLKISRDIMCDFQRQRICQL